MLNALGVDLTEIIFALVNFLILVFFLGKFLYKPTLAMFEKRRNTIQTALDDAANAREEAIKAKEDYEMQIADAESEAREIVKEARLHAEQQAAKIIEEAATEAAALKAQAASNIEREKARAVNDMKVQVAELAILVAQQVMEKEISVTGESEIVDGIIERVGASEWQN